MHQPMLFNNRIKRSHRIKGSGHFRAKIYSKPEAPVMRQHTAKKQSGSARSQALVLELSRLSRGQAQRAESLRSARVAFAQIKLVATPPDGPRRVRAKIVNSIS